MSVFIFCLCFGLLFAEEDPFVITQELIDTVNSHFGVTWKAGWNKRFHNVRRSTVVNMLGVLDGTTCNEPYELDMGVNNGPASYFFNDEHPDCVQPVKDQGLCGSCWAFSASEVVEDRICVKTNKTVRIAPQDWVSCDEQDNGCFGGNYDNLWHYAIDNGVVTENCFEYRSGVSGYTPICPHECDDPKKLNWNDEKHYVSSYTPDMKPEDVYNEIPKNGPVQAGMAVYEDFMSYQSGIYSHVTGSFLGYHAIKLLGWGTKDGTDYWILQNSWGTDWGMDGFFWIKRGSFECRIEEHFYVPVMKV